MCSYMYTCFHCSGTLNHGYMASELLGLTPYVIIKEEDLTFVARSHQLSKYQMSLCVRKPIIRVLTRFDTNQAVQSQKMVRGWKFWIYKVEELCYSCSENKGADQLRSNCEADLRLCFCKMQIVGFPMQWIKSYHSSWGVQMHN